MAKTKPSDETEPSTNCMLAIVARDIFEENVKDPSLGEVVKWDRYLSKQPSLRKLKTGGTLYAVTARPGGALWLAYVYRDVLWKADGLRVRRSLACRVTDITHLRGKLEFANGQGVAKGPLGPALQTPRMLTPHDIALLEKALCHRPPKPSNAEKTEGNAKPMPSPVYKPEFHGIKWIGAQPAKVANVIHGRVVAQLKRELSATGLKCANTKAVDLRATDRKSGLTTLFEVKTSSDTTSIYCAVGQLLFHALHARERRVAVLPRQGLPRSTVAKLRELGLALLPYRVDRHDTVRFELDVASVLAG